MSRPLDDEARKALRDQARVWLTEDLAIRNKLLESANQEQRDEIQRVMAYWLADPDLKSIRDAEALETLAESERSLFQTLWTDVQDLRSRCANDRP